MYYAYNQWGIAIPQISEHNQKDSETMKNAVRFFALSVVLAGAAAASVFPSNPRLIASHQAAPAGMPIPTCAPGLPTCPVNMPNGR